MHVLVRAQVHQRREILGAHVTAELGLRSAVVLHVQHEVVEVLERLRALAVDALVHLQQQQVRVMSIYKIRASY